MAHKAAVRVDLTNIIVKCADNYASPAIPSYWPSLVVRCFPSFTPGTTMATKRPLCNYDGEIRELAVTDTLTGSTIVSREIPAGTKNGTNQAFSLADTPVTGSEQVYVNGILQSDPDDYDITGTTITFITAPVSTDIILVTYWK